MFGETVYESTDKEKQATEKHGELPTIPPRDGGGNQRRQQRRQVQRRGEHRECLAVVLAVLVRRFVQVLFPVHRREKLEQKRIHGRDPT